MIVIVIVIVDVMLNAFVINVRFDMQDSGL